MRDRSAAVAGPLRTLFAIGAAGALSDGELLGRYLDGRAEEAECAFAALVERHGPMVRHVGLAVLGDPHDASDAFQATFLVLARRAGSIRKAESVGPWLFGVARRVAIRAKAAAARRRRAERAASAIVATGHVEQPPEDWAALYEELDRLPSRYRDAIVLCYLEGLSHEQAAARLGCPIGTLCTRLLRARDRLRGRLSRRGLAPSPVAVAVLSSAVSPSARAAVPTALASAASRLAIASRGLPAAALTVPLASSTLRSMTMIALTRSLALGGATLIGLGAGVAGLASWGNGGAVPGLEAAPPTSPVALASAEVRQDDPEPGPADPSPAGSQARPGEEAIRTRSEVEDATIIMLLPQGTKVVKGQLVCELDPEPLKDWLAAQQIATERAQADYQNAMKVREVADREVNRFDNGTYPLELLVAEGEVAIARAELELAQERQNRVERLAHGPVQDVISKTELKSAQIEVLRAEWSLKKAEKTLEVLRTHTYETQLQSLQAAVERAKADELAEKSAFEWEKVKEERSRRMIEKCKIHAPRAGVVSYPSGIEEGATVRERQFLFEILPPPEDEEGAAVRERRAPFEVDPPR